MQNFYLSRKGEFVQNMFLFCCIASMVLEGAKLNAGFGDAQDNCAGRFQIVLWKDVGIKNAYLYFCEPS